MQLTPRVLVVEDEAITAMLLRHDLSRAGYQVPPPQATGESAVEAARADSFDVILMDINLAGRMDGIEAALSIREFCPAPVIFVTGYRDDEIRQRAEAVRPAGFMVKPVTVQQLKPVIDEALRSSREKSG
jgi:CheY-like chemotaxis protein